MKELRGRTAFITGAASGIGLGMARMLAREGVNIALADIQTERLQEAEQQVQAFGVKTTTVRVDVSLRDDVERAADAVEAALGPVHIVCNNAGVSMGGVPIEKLTPREWEWTLAVNLWGVIHGVSTFLPRLLKHGQGGHFVNTSSVAGLVVNKERSAPAYATSKSGVVSLTEALANEVPENIGVSVLCPAVIATNLWSSSLQRPERFGGAYERETGFATRSILEQGMAPDTVGEMVVQAIRDRDFFIMTHTWPRERIEARHARMMAAFDRCEVFTAARGATPAAPPRGKQAAGS